MNVVRPATKGANLVRVRAHNERLVLSELRAEPQSRADLARRTGLSAQTITQIVRALVIDGLVRTGEPVRGRVGQPSVPLALDPQGAWFGGLTIGRREVELVLMDFDGTIVADRSVDYRWPDPRTIARFVCRHWPSMVADVPPGRLHGLGIAQPFDLWQWPERLGAPAETLGRWQHAELGCELADALGLPVFVENDATAACGAELTFGLGRRMRDFAYFYIGDFIGGGVALDGKVHVGPTGNAGAFGSLPVRDPDEPSRRVQLIDAASLYLLETLIHDRNGDVSATLRDERSSGWSLNRRAVADWSANAAHALAEATVAVSGVLGIETVVIDGPFPAAQREAIVALTGAALMQLDTRGLHRPTVVAGTLGSRAPTLGATRLPLFARFLLDQTVLTDVR